MATPYFSVVVASRNDQHGGNLLLRMQAFVNAFVAQMDRHGIPCELVLVEWNPPDDTAPLLEQLRWPPSTTCAIRVIQVPSGIHQRYRHAAQLPLYQMLAKNVGIRRASGEFVLATNVDIIFSDPLMNYLAARSLRAGAFYRSDRYDIENDLNADWPLERLLDFCANHCIRINQKEGSRNCHTGQVHQVYSPKTTADSLGYPLLHTNACGDFTLLARQDWQRLRGYLEWDLYSFHLDSLFLYQAYYAGCREVMLPDDCVHYHIEHQAGWTPEIHASGMLEQRLDNDRIARLSNQDLRNAILDMAKNEAPVLSNGEDWGLAGETLPEWVIPAQSTTS